MKRTRVAITTRIPVSAAGGLEASVREIAPRMAARRPTWDVRVVNAFAAVRAWNRIPFLGDVLAALSLAAKVVRFDVVVVSGGEYAWPRVLRERDRARTVVVWHGTRAGEIPALTPDMTFPIAVYRQLEVWLQRWALRARRHIAVSVNTAAELEATYASGVSVRIVPNGAPAFAPPAARAERGTHRVAWIGTNGYKKGLDVALAACELARATLVDLELVVIGLPAPRPSLRAWVTYAGRVDHAASLACLRSADVLLATSRYEGCSVAIIEALALGIPIAAGPTVAWMVGDAGTAAESFTAEAFGRLLVSLFETPDRLNGMSVAGPRQARRFDWNVATEAYVEEVERCLASR